VDHWFLHARLRPLEERPEQRSSSLTPEVPTMQLKQSAKTTLLLLALLSPLGAQLKRGNYLVGTQGWIDGIPFDGFNSIQALDPYTGKARVLDVQGVPANELAGDFLINSPTSFYLGTKVAAAPAEGNVYLVSYNGDNWQAQKVNTSKLGINVASIERDGTYLYVCGVDSFANTSSVAQVLRIKTADGSVTTLSKFGSAFMTGGAIGIPGGMIRIGTKLHMFTFNGAPNVTNAEHWTVTTTTPAVAAKLGPDLPPSQRFPGRAFACSDAVLDPVSGNIAVIGRWGEIVFRNPATGANVQYERYPGLLIFTGDGLSQAPRAATLNSDTQAIAFGDHRDHLFGTTGIDERRWDGASPSEPFSENVVMTKQPKVREGALLTTVSALAYLPTGAVYHKIGKGCAASNGAVPGSYVTSPPTAGNGRFAFTVKTAASNAILHIGSQINQDLTGIGAPGCFDYVAPDVIVPIAVDGGLGSYRMVLPASLPAGTTMFAQWQVIDAAANTLGQAFSEGRKVQVN